MQDLLVIVCKQVRLVRHQHKVPILKLAMLPLCMKIQTNRTVTVYIPGFLMDIFFATIQPTFISHPISFQLFGSFLLSCGHV